MEKILNYIGGALVEPLSGNYFDNINPSTGKVYSLIPHSDSMDVDRAVQAAEKAKESWAKMPVKKRSEILLKIAALIDENCEELAMAESMDNGKPVKLAREVDIPRASLNMSFFATAILHFSSEAHATDSIAINYTIREPLGIVGCISPWNLPLYLFTWKIAPALASGNCVIGKPSELTPMTAFLFSKLCIQAGLPAGVLNIIHGQGNSCGQAIVEHREISAISFTGGTVTGKKIASIAAPEFKKLSLELGGKNPNIVFGDCDYEEALRTSVLSAFSNQGEICLCGSRIFVERNIYDRFVKDFVLKTEKLSIGDPKDPDTRIGAVVSEGHMNKILSYIALAKEEGGVIQTGGERAVLSGDLQGGFFLRPTVITGLDAHCRVNQEEIFGPVTTIIPFDSEEEVVLLANSTKYGLSATVWTENLKKAHRMGNELKAGIVWINCWLLRDLRTPFGGMKESGVGREGGWEALKFFTEPKNICVKL